MIDQVDDQLVAWVTQVVGDVTVHYEMPVDQQTASGVVLYLLSFAPTPPASNGRVAPLQCTLRYLVTTWAETPPAAHKLLGTLLFAAMEDSAYEVELEPIPAETWLALKTPPQPAFVLRVLLRKPRPERATRYVTQPLAIQSQPAITLFGAVRGPEDMPIAGARVELRNDPHATYTDAKGRFVFNNLPAGMPLRLRVKAKGRVFDVTVERQTTKEEPFIIPFTLE